jgi:hypothetical protein
MAEHAEGITRMKHSKLFKATLGAGLLIALSGTAVLAHTATEQTHVFVTVTPDTESIALRSSCVVVEVGDCPTAFNVAGEWHRNANDEPLVNVNNYTQHLEYVTDWSGDTIHVTAAPAGLDINGDPIIGGDPDNNELAPDSVTINVTAAAPSAGDPTPRAGEDNGDGSTVALSSTAKTDLITGIDAFEARVIATSALSFSTDIGINADIATHSFTLTYTLDGAPARP